MKFSIVLALSSLASIAFGAPAAPPALTQRQAELLVSRYAAVIAQQPSDIGNATETAIAITAPSYTEQSDSANIQLGIPLGALTTASKDVFVTASQSNPPVTFDTIAVYVANRRYVVWQWSSVGFGSGQYPVKGFHLFSVGPRGRITKSQFEFNSIAGALDIGFQVNNPDGTPLVVTIA